MAEPIVGNPTTTPMAIPDWNQTNPLRADYIKNKPNLSKVATSGSYNDLSDKPDIPSTEGLASEEYVDRKIKDVELSGKMNVGFGIPFDESGADIVSIDKVHPKEHDVEVAIERRNLISPSVFADYVLQEDGSYWATHANATKTYNFELPAGTYTVSYQIKADANSGFRLFLLDENGTKYDKFITHTGEFVPCSFTFTCTTKIVQIFFSFSIPSTMGVYFKDLLIEKGSVAKPYTPPVDIESVTVLGGNFIPFPYINMTETMNGVTFTVNEDGTVTANGTASAQAYIVISSKAKLNLANGTYYLSGVPSENNEDRKCYMAYANCITDGRTDGVLVEINDSIYQNYMTCVVSAGKTVENFVFKPMLEVGTKATEFEKYKNPVTYPVADGKVVVKSVSPTMNIKAVGANINAKGYQDGLAVIDELKQAIISLGGNV